MTEFEYVEAFGSLSELGATNAMDFITVFFAYVVTARFAGKEMGKWLAISVSILYSLFLLGPLGGMTIRADQLHSIILEAQILFPDSVYFRRLPSNLPAALAATLGPCVLGWIFSLLYMHKIIRNSEA